MAADTIRFIVTVAIVVYKGLIPVVGRMLTEKCHDVWLNTIRKMIYAFEEYQRNDKYDIDEEKRERIREGMQLFIDYYRNLWI